MEIVKKTITSKRIAEISNKTHANVMKAIRKMEDSWEKINGVKFDLVKYIDQKGEERPMYELSETESIYIASKFNDEVRAKIVLEWEQYKKFNPNSISRKDIALMLLQSEEEKEKLESKVKALKPKAELYKKLVNAEGLISMSQAAKLLKIDGLGRNNLMKRLREEGIFFKRKNEPKQKYVDSGYFVVKQSTYTIQKDGESVEHINFVTYCTEKGLTFIDKRFNQREIA